MQELELTWGRTLKMWWVILWRGVLLTVPAGFAAGATIGALLMILKLPITQNPAEMRLAGGIAGYLASLPIFLVVFRMAIRKRYKDFKVVLLPLAERDSPKL